MTANTWPADKPERRKVADLIPYANNARVHTDKQVNQVAALIKEFGFTNPVLIDEENMILAGHCRLMAAQKLGLGEIPTIKAVGWTEAQKKAYILADNQSSLNSTWDFEIAGIEFDGLEDLGFDVSLIGFDEDTLENLGLSSFDGGANLPELDSGDKQTVGEMTFSLASDQIDLIHQALSIAKKAGEINHPLNSNQNGNALATICQQYVSQST